MSIEASMDTDLTNPQRSTSSVKDVSSDRAPFGSRRVHHLDVKVRFLDCE